MILLVALFSASALAAAAYGAYLAYLRWRQEMFIRSGRAEFAKGVCVNLRWTSGRLVASGIRYTDKQGRKHVAWTRSERTIPVAVGRTAEVQYDPEGKASALINGVADGTGSYGFAAGCFALSAILLFNGIRLI
ncbi:hypothetical protein OHB31_22050 [Streptomyces microflavus]|uniref:hypothetical protein n=1 Tax=Streptomyces microflavus TaxID=1919 RepID=UPI002DD81FA0|nr:hypothetical protein [Streptomyces microflavus]WSA62658.1 hypothetical protein OHB31_22050 [Streptomyces microflavus]